MFLCLNCNSIKRHNIWRNIHHFRSRQVGWLVVFRINVDLAIFQPYLDLEAGDNQSLKIQVPRPGIEPRTSCSASQELNHSTTLLLTSRQAIWLFPEKKGNIPFVQHESIEIILVCDQNGIYVCLHLAKQQA